MRDFDMFIKVIADGMKSVAEAISETAEKIESLTVSGVRFEEPVSVARPSEPYAPPAAARPTARLPRGTARDRVYQIISRSRKGVNSATIQGKTGFDDKKIQNIIYKLKKLGKIRSERKGLYVKA